MLSVSQKLRYGLAALYELAVRYQDGPVQIREIASVHEVPQPYLEQLMGTLKRSGLVQSYRGSQGGYALTRNPATLLVSDALVALEGPISVSGGNKNDTLGFFWNRVETEVQGIFNGSLQDLVLEKQKHEKVLMYSI